jgi:hypothetical protein
LLCKCSGYQSCHRKVIVDLLLHVSAVKVIQPEQIRSGGGAMTLAIRES